VQPADPQKLRDLEQRVQKLEARMDQAHRALNQRGQGSFTLLTTVRTSRPLDRSVRALRLDTNVGDIKLIRSDSAELTVEANVRVKPSVDRDKASKDFDQHVRIAQTGDVLTVADAHKDAPDHDAWSVALKVAIPRTLPVTAHTAVGNIAVELASGAVSLSTGVGNLTLKADAVTSVSGNTGTGNATFDLGEVTGRVEAKAGTGSVKLSVANPVLEADITLTSGTGDLVLELPAEPNGRFDLKTGVGSISVDGLRGVQVKKNVVGASASAQLGERGPRFKLHTGVGSITTTVRK
jgi:hypothetical protein